MYMINSKARQKDIQ